MCGLVGQLRWRRGAEVDADRELIRRLAALAARRGPDDEGVWSDGGHCTLGFRRLSILDLSPAGHQPMCTADGRYTMVYNGELYNFRQLRAALQDAGVRLRSSGDSEVVLYALATWGSDALQYF